MLKKLVTGFWINDPKTGKPSVSLTLATYTFVISMLLLVLSQFQTIAGVTLREYTTSDLVAHNSPFLALYFGRKWTTKNDVERSDPASKDNQ